MTIALNNIRIVLVATSHPGNIGATARAMKNMGLGQLYLVEPKIFPHSDASVRAAGADDILASAVVVPSLDAAIVDCALVIGTSGRLRTMPIDCIDPHQGAKLAISAALQGDVALIFGSERSGLSNDELLRCHYHVQIPTVADFSALNLAAAVQVLVYELYMAAKSPTEIDTFYDELATAGELQLYYEHLERTLVAIDFFEPNKAKHLLRRIRRLYNRAKVEKVELNILRGILTATQKSIGK